MRRSRRDRALPAPAARVVDRVRQGIGVAELRDLEPRVEAVAEAVAENTSLAQPLERRVADLERALLPLLERPVTRRSSGG